MAIHRGSNQPKLAPTVTTDAVLTFNENQGHFRATVDANDYTTTAYFDYSTSSSFNPGTYITVTYPFTIASQSSFDMPVFGLSAGTTYYVRCRATNAIGSTTANTVSFTTWSLKTFTQTTAGYFGIYVPSIPGVAPVIYEMLAYGGGGGANYGGGGGGGYRIFSSHTSSTTGTQLVEGSIGGGGAAGNGGGGTGSATSGGTTSLYIGSSAWFAGGGGAGQHPGSCGSSCGGRGGTVGSGQNGENLGGCNTYGFYTIVSYTFICTEYDKLGNCTNGYNQPNYGYNCGYYAGGGGGGTDSAGSSACCQDSASHIGGNGGTGGGAYGLRGGNGGGGQGTQGNGSAGGFSVGSGTIVGSGGSVFNAGTAGGITFKYYGP